MQNSVKLGGVGGHLSYPASEGRDSSQKRLPWESTAVPPRLLDAPETRSAVMGDFQEPYGAVALLP